VVKVKDAVRGDSHFPLKKRSPAMAEIFGGVSVIDFVLLVLVVLALIGVFMVKRDTNRRMNETDEKIASIQGYQDDISQGLDRKFASLKADVNEAMNRLTMKLNELVKQINATLNESKKSVMAEMDNRTNPMKASLTETRNSVRKLLVENEKEMKRMSKELEEFSKEIQKMRDDIRERTFDLEL
jgi:peptidoglycan hydrolase CwlO-like protein